MSALRTLPRRAAFNKANAAFKKQFAAEIDDTTIYRADVCWIGGYTADQNRMDQHILFHPNPHMGVLKHASLPVPDPMNGDWVSFSTYFNEPGVIYAAKSINLMEDDQYFNILIRNSIDQYPYLQQFIDIFDGKAPALKPVETDIIAKSTSADMAKAIKEAIDKNNYELFVQLAHWLGWNVYRNLRRAFFGSVQGNRMRMQPKLWREIGHRTLTNISENEPVVDGYNHIYTGINGTKFNSLFNHNYVTRSDKNGGKYYCDNISIQYSTLHQTMTVDYTVVHVKVVDGKEIRSRDTPAL